MFDKFFSTSKTSNFWQKQVESTLSDLIIGQLSTPFQDIAKQVKEDGFMLLPNVFSGDVIKQFRKEFDDFIDTSDDSHYHVAKHDDAVCVRVSPRKSLDKNRFPLTSAFFDSVILRHIAECFYETGSRGIIYNSEIFVHKTPETLEPLSGKLHWDRAQTLKFWIYIDDIPLEAGPMRTEKGSCAYNRNERLMKSSGKQILVGGEDNLAKANNEMVNLIGSAGTVLIHDTDASHGATPVSKGYVRRIMRGHTRKSN